MTPDLLSLGESFYSTQRYYGATHRFAMAQAVMYVRRKAPEIDYPTVSAALAAHIPDPVIVLQGL